MMKRLLLGLMLGLTSTTAMAEWSRVGENDDSIQYVDKASLYHAPEMLGKALVRIEVQESRIRLVF